MSHPIPMPLSIPLASDLRASARSVRRNWRSPAALVCVAALAVLGCAHQARPPKTPNPWFFLERAYPLGEIPKDAWRAAQLQAWQMRSEVAERGDRGAWIFRGPNNIGGRITDLAVDPTDASRVFAGAAEGGVLRTTDSGQHWTPLFDQQATLSIGALALDPVDPHIVYAGTGEVNPGGGSVAYGGVGLLRSTDSGDTWSSIGLEETGSIGRVRIDPTNPQRIYVAAMGNLWAKGNERGVFRSTDGGSSWEKVLFVSDSTGAVDLLIRPGQPNTIFASMWERIRRPRAYRYGGITCGVYKSTDGGDTWALVGGGLPSPSNNIGRIGLALCASQPDMMYAVYADRTGYFAGVYRSTNGGTSWSRVNDGALNSVFSSFGWWFGNIRVHPNDPNRVWVLGVPLYRSTNGGSSWSDVSGSMHVDHHAMEFGPGENPVIYEGNDGGIYRSTNGGSSWTMFPDQPITQIYRVALDAHNANALYGGAQDNGTVRTLTGNLNDWVMIYGGDGFQPLVHPVNSNRIWAQYQYGSLNYSSNGGSSWTGATNGISSGDRFNWNTAVRFDPTNPDRMFYGTQRVYRSTNGTSWTAISPDLTGGAGGGGQGQVYGTLTTLDASPLDAQVIWAGADDGHVQVTTNGGSSWTDVSAELPDRWVTSVKPSPHDRATCVVTISGFRWNSPLPHVYRTTDLGATWTAIAGNLPEAPANDIILDPLHASRMYVATDVGVFETRNGGESWSVLGGNLPMVVVTSLAFEPLSRTLVAGTYGRSFFSYGVDQVSDVALEPQAISALLAPEPNPSSDGCWIRLARPIGAAATAEIFSVAGRRVRQLAIAEGAERVRWDGRDERGHAAGAGTYLCRVASGGTVIGTVTLNVIPRP